MATSVHGNICTVAMATAVIRIMKFQDDIWAMEHPENKKFTNFKIVAVATVVPGISSKHNKL